MGYFDLAGFYCKLCHRASGQNVEIDNGTIPKVGMQKSMFVSRPQIASSGATFAALHVPAAATWPVRLIRTKLGDFETRWHLALSGQNLVISSRPKFNDLKLAIYHYL
jgi:hypothetical protein